jgi:hypothetical protein
MTTGSVIRDKNRVPIWWGVSSVDGTTLTPIQIDSSTAYPMMEIGVSVMPVIASLPDALPREENRIPCLAGVSNANATQFIPVSVNPTNGAIQVQTT